MRILILFLSLFVSIAEARMYQWVDPDSGTTQLSGKPPAWYRSENGGPRVFVFDGGRLVDDTKIDVSDDIRQGMREQAFIKAQEDEKKAEEQLAKSRELKDKLDELERLEAAQAEAEQGLLDEEIVSDEFDTDGILSELITEEESTVDEQPLQDVEELKKLIRDWEEAQSENAKKAIQ